MIPKFKKGMQITIFRGDYKGLQGIIIKSYLDKTGRNNIPKFRYDVKINGGWCNKGAGMKNETNFYGISYYGKIISCDEETLKPGKKKGLNIINKI